MLKWIWAWIRPDLSMIWAWIRPDLSMIWADTIALNQGYDLHNVVILYQTLFCEMQMICVLHFFPFVCRIYPMQWTAQRWQKDLAFTVSEGASGTSRQHARRVEMASMKDLIGSAQIYKRSLINWCQVEHMLRFLILFCFPVLLFWNNYLWKVCYHSLAIV